MRCALFSLSLEEAKEVALLISEGECASTGAIHWSLAKKFESTGSRNVSSRSRCRTHCRTGFGREVPRQFFLPGFGKCVPSTGILVLGKGGKVVGEGVVSKHVATDFAVDFVFQTCRMVVEPLIYKCKPLPPTAWHLPWPCHWT